MKYILRSQYLDTLNKLRDTDLIKVITGLRRSGKSTLLNQFRDQIADSVAPDRIQKYDFESREAYTHRSWEEIYDQIDNNLVKGKKNYIFLDEVQNVENFERLLDALYVDKDIDLYVTGSNAYLLSSELATLLTGRAFTINILPFSFREFYQTFSNFETPEAAFEKYLRASSLPQSAELMRIDPALVMDYVRTVYDDVFENDIMARHTVMSRQAFASVANFTMDNIGNLLSPNKIADLLAKDGKQIDSRTVESYIEFLTDSYVFYKATRFDIKGKQHLATREKYYLADIGFRNALLGRESGADAGRILENIIFLELLRRYRDVWIGKAGNQEIDFVVRDELGATTYFQVAYTVRDEATLLRELMPFESVKDHNQKFLITMDPEEVIRNGVRQINAIKFLLGTSTLFNE